MCISPKLFNIPERLHTFCNRIIKNINKLNRINMITIKFGEKAANPIHLVITVLPVYNAYLKKLQMTLSRIQMSLTSLWF